MENTSKREMAIFLALGLVLVAFFASCLVPYGSLANQTQIGTILISLFFSLCPFLYREKIVSNKLEKISGIVGYVLTVLFFWNMSQANTDYIGIIFFLAFMLVLFASTKSDSKSPLFVTVCLYLGLMTSLVVISLFPQGIGLLEMPLSRNQGDYFSHNIVFLGVIIGIVFINILINDKKNK